MRLKAGSGWHTFNSSVWEAGAGTSLTFKASVVSGSLPGQQGLHSEILPNRILKNQTKPSQTKEHHKL